MERISRDDPEPNTRGHHIRYRLASSFVKDGDVVLDAACGIGYGFDYMPSKAGYIGVDKDISVVEEKVNALEVDLNSWMPSFDFDVFIGFETIEHVQDYMHYIEIAKKANNWAILSAPVVPTKHLNPYHIHDFKPGEIPELFVDGDWHLYYMFDQPLELSEIYIFKKGKL